MRGKKVLNRKSTKNISKKNTKSQQKSRSRTEFSPQLWTGNLESHLSFLFLFISIKYL